MDYCQSMMNDHSLLPLARDDARSSTRARERARKKYFYASSSPSSSISRRASTRATANRTSHHPMNDRDRREFVKIAGCDRAPRAVVRLGAERHGAGAVADRGGGGDLERIFRAGTVTADDNLRARA